jgi:HK97 family phage major capsid protein/HK97 family phage prohead protease
MQSGETMEKLELPVLTRAASTEAITVDAESRTMEFPFSSELPVERWFGDEVLSHNAGAADLKRLNDGAPLLFNHNMDEIVGVVERAWIDKDKRGYAKVRFAKTARADEVMGLVNDGILRNVSFGYRIMDMVESKKSGQSTYTATRWEAYEVSMVTIPADPTVGVGRAEANEKRAVNLTREDPPAQPAETTNEDTMSEQTVDIQTIATQAAEAERSRIASISALGERFKQQDLARTLIDSGKSLDEARAAILESISVEQKPVTGTETDIGLTQKEVREYSFLRAMNALANPGDRAAWEAAAFEREVSEAGAKAAGKSSRGIFVPSEILRNKRDLTAGTNNAGGFTVATDLLAASFIEMLRNRAVVMRSGATMLSGLVGNVAIPKQSAAATAYWVAENSAPTESQQTLAQVTMNPKTVGAWTDISRRLLNQSSIDVEAMVRRDLSSVIALAIDAAALYGSGSSNQPTGIKNQTGVNTKDFAATNPTFAELVAMETEVATDNADIGTMVYLFNPAQRGALKTTEKATNTAQFVWEPGNTVNGYRTETSNQVTAGDVFFGNFADLLIGMWAGLDLMVDPYSGSTAGTVRVVALQDIDIAVRNAVSFVYGDADIA